MKRMRLSTLFLCLIFPLVGMPQSSESADAWEKHEKVDETVCVLPLNVTALNLSHTEISSRCPEASKICAPRPDIRVAVTAPDPEGEEIIYLNTIGVGKIIGSGANVVWDLSNVDPGEYTITAAVDFEGNPWKRPLGTTQTRTITVTDKVARIESEPKGK